MWYLIWHASPNTLLNPLMHAASASTLDTVYNKLITISANAAVQRSPHINIRRYTQITFSEMPNVHIIFLFRLKMSLSVFMKVKWTERRSPSRNNYVDMHTKVRFHCYIKRDISDTSFRNDYPVWNKYILRFYLQEVLFRIKSWLSGILQNRLVYKELL